MEEEMRTSSIKRDAKKTIDELSAEKLIVAKDFLDYLKQKEGMDATLEVLNSTELMEQIGEAETAAKEGKLDEFISWEKVKRDV